MPLLSAALTLLMASVANAVSVDRSRAPQGGDLTPVRSTAIGPHLGWDAGLQLSYAHSPVMVTGPKPAALVAHRTALTAAGGVNAFGRVRLTLELPFVLYQSHEARAVRLLAMKRPRHVGPGDVRVEATALLFAGGPLPSVGLVAGLTLPTARARLLAGEARPTLTSEVVASQRFGSLAVAVNGGVHLRGQARLGATRLGDQLVLGASATLDRFLPLRLAFAAHGATPAGRGFADSRRTPLELVGAAAWALDERHELLGGFAMGATNAIGASDVRFIAGMRIVAAPPSATFSCDDPPCDRGTRDPEAAPRPPAESDADHDQIPNWRDACPYEPETVDGVADDDGCPEAERDTDGDMMLDSVDLCPTVPEDVDGERDDDGCPDPALPATPAAP